MKASLYNSNYELTDEQKRELDRRLDDHEKGLSKNIPAKELMKKLRAKFKK